MGNILGSGPRLSNLEMPIGPAFLPKTSVHQLETIIPPYIITGLLQHYEDRLARYRAKKENVKIHHFNIQTNLQHLEKESITAEQIAEIKKVIEEIFKFFSTRSSKNSQQPQHSEGSVENFSLANFSLDEILTQDLPIEDLKKVLKTQVTALLERLAQIKNKETRTKKELDLTKKQLEYDQKHVHIDNEPFIFDKASEMGQKLEDALISFGEIIVKRASDILNSREAPEAEKNPLNPQFPAAVYDAKNRSRLPGTLVFDNSVDPDSKAVELGEAVNLAYQNTENVLKFWEKTFNISFDQVDGMEPGQKANAVIHFMKQYVNAFFDGKQMVYGDGNQYFAAFYKFLMIAGHEMGHALIGNTLNYQSQSGALNESYADVLGACADMFVNNVSVNDYSWLVGKDLVTYKEQKYALRTFEKGPAYVDVPVLGGTDPQPDEMPDAAWFRENRLILAQDNGGVHILSKIPNRVFYMVAMAQNEWNAPLLFWKRVLDQIQDPDITFAEFAGLQIDLANQENNQELVKQLQQAWSEVGIVPMTASMVDAPRPSIEILEPAFV